MAEICVIVPVYNVECYLQRCIDSILVQTYTNFDLVLIDDGSTDRCGEICDRYALNDSRIHVIHQENRGLSGARNAGIDWAFQNSMSDWLTFVDSDDWIHSQYLEILLNAAIENNLNISIGNALWTKGEQLPDKIDESPQIWNTADYFLSNSINASVAWGKLYRKCSFQNIRYPLGKIHEDEYVTYKLLFMYSQVSVVDAPLYGYYQNENGIMKRKWSINRLDAIEGLEGQLTFFYNKGLIDIAEGRFKALTFVILDNMEKVRACPDLSSSEKKQYIKLLRKKLRGYLYQYKNNNWVTIHDGKVIAGTSVILAFLRRVWVRKIKPILKV